jgi:GMP synthase-like glutamine amidotransferase
MREVIVVRHQSNVPLAALEPGLEGVPWRYVDAWTDPEWPIADDIAGLIVLGGKMSALQDDEYPFLKQVRELMTSALERDVPVLGSCLGSQLLAEVAGGGVYRMDKPELGFVEVSLTVAGRSDAIASPVGGLERVLVWHEDSYDLPVSVEVLASSAMAPNQAFRVGSGYGIQFHVEATEREIAGWADETDPGELRDWWGADKRALLAAAERYLPAQREAAAAVARAFVGLISL